MAFAIQFVIDVLSLGGAYALMALGLVIIYGILRLVNFAYGELIMVAGYTMFLASGSGLPWIVMAVLAVGMAILFGIITDYAAFRPVRAKSVTAVLITSFAFSNCCRTRRSSSSRRALATCRSRISSRRPSRSAVRSPRSAISSPSPPPSHCSPASPS